MSIISLLVALFILCVVMYVIYLIVTKFIQDTTLRTIALLIFGLIAFLLILNMLGIGPSLGLHL